MYFRLKNPKIVLKIKDGFWIETNIQHVQLKVFLSFQSLALSRFSACICAPGCPCRSASETSTRNGKARVIWGSKPKEGGGGVYLFPSPRKSELKQQKYKGFLFFDLLSSIFLHALCGKYDRIAPFCVFNEAYVLLCEM